MAAVAVVLIMLAATLPASVSVGQESPEVSRSAQGSFVPPRAHVGSSLEWATPFITEESRPSTRSARLAACELGETVSEACASPLAPVANVEDVPHVAIVGDDEPDAVLTLTPETHYVHHGDLLLRGKLVIQAPTREASIFRLTVLGDLVIEGEIVALPAASGERAPLVRDGTSIVLEATESILVREGARIAAGSGLDGWTSVANGPHLEARGQDGGHGGSIALWAEGVRVGHDQTEPGAGGQGGDAFGGLGADAVGGDGGDGGAATANGAVIDGASAGDGGSATAAGDCLLCDVFPSQTTNGDDDCNAHSRQTAPEFIDCLIPDDDGGQSPCVTDPRQCAPSDLGCNIAEGCTPTPPTVDPTWQPTPPPPPSPPPTPPSPCPRSVCSGTGPTPPTGGGPGTPTPPPPPPTPPVPTDPCPQSVCTVPTSTTQPTGPTSCGSACEPPVTSTTYPTPTTTSPTVSTTQPTSPSSPIVHDAVETLDALVYVPPGSVGTPGSSGLDTPHANGGSSCRTYKRGADGAEGEDGGNAVIVCGSGRTGRNGAAGTNIPVGPITVCTAGEKGEDGLSAVRAGDATGGNGGDGISWMGKGTWAGRGGDAVTSAGWGGDGGDGGAGAANPLVPQLTCYGGAGGQGGNGGSSSNARGGDGGYGADFRMYKDINDDPRAPFVFSWRFEEYCGGGGDAFSVAGQGGTGGLNAEPRAPGLSERARSGLDGQAGTATRGSDCPQRA